MVILGLGNPGKKYFYNRHNVGLRVISELLSRVQIIKRTWRQKYFRAREVEICSKNVILATTTTFMNESGTAALAICTKFNIKPDELFLIYDDVNLDPGRLRIKKKGSSGGHKGVQSIIDALGTEEIPRLKLGIGMPEGNQNLVDYVLSDFKDAEKDIVEKMIKDAADAVELILKEGIEKAMAQVNGRT